MKARGLPPRHHGLPRVWLGRAIAARGHTTLLPSVNREVAGRRGFYASPSLHVIDWQNGHAFINDEPPGPSLLLYRVKSWEEAVALHNKLLYRVSTSLFVDPGQRDLPEIIGRLKTGSLNAASYTGRARACS